MHELSIACSIVETVEESLPDDGTRVSRVFIKIGKLSGVVREALEFSFDIATQDTRLEGSVLEVEGLAVIVHCDKCGVDTTLGDPPIFRCGECGESTANIVQGKEMEIVSVEIINGESENT